MSPDGVEGCCVWVESGSPIEAVCLVSDCRLLEVCVLVQHLALKKLKACGWILIPLQLILFFLDICAYHYSLRLFDHK